MRGQGKGVKSHGRMRGRSSGCGKGGVISSIGLVLPERQVGVEANVTWGLVRRAGVLDDDLGPLLLRCAETRLRIAPGRESPNKGGGNILRLSKWLQEVYPDRGLPLIVRGDRGVKRGEVPDRSIF